MKAFRWVVVFALCGIMPLFGHTVTVLRHFTDGDSADSLLLSGGTLYGMMRLGGANHCGEIFRINTGGAGYTNLHSFSYVGGDGTFPMGSLILSGSFLYGMTVSGGTGNCGMIFRINTDGAGYTNLHNFTGDGYSPYGSLTLSGSLLYGMTQRGGLSDRGSVFRMNTDGTGYTNLHLFTGAPNGGANPQGNLLMAGSRLYGMTEYGGVSNKGVIFRMNTDGSDFSVLHHFVGGTNDGANPVGSLTLSGLTLYGMTPGGGTAGTIFRLNTDGSSFSILHAFQEWLQDGAYPRGNLTLSGATLYGMTEQGGNWDNGCIFKLTTDGSWYNVIQNLSEPVENPRGSLVVAGAMLYGTAFPHATPDAVVFSLAMESNSIALSGDMAFGDVQLGSSADRVLTITNSGSGPLEIRSISCPSGFSVAWHHYFPQIDAHSASNFVITFTPTNNATYNGEITVYSDAVTGSNTIAVSGIGITTKVIGVGGNLAFAPLPVGETATRTLTIYNLSNTPLQVSGIAYPAGFTGAWTGRVEAGGASNVMVSFAPTAAIAYSGEVSVLSDAIRGTNTIAISGAGIPPTVGVAYSNLHMFAGQPADGGNPIGSLLLSGGVLYGMTPHGGAGNKGVVFKLNTDGSGYTRLRDFQGGGSDGSTPHGDLSLAGSTLYGMTYLGGDADAGVIFSMDVSGAGYVHLHEFNVSNGGWPHGSLLSIGSVLIGMTSDGGDNNAGVAFSIQTSGSGFTGLHTFSLDAGDGANPYGALAVSGAALYGMTEYGGALNGGALFRVNSDGSGFTQLHSFMGGANDGQNPRGAVTLLGASLYGISSAGGTGGKGLVFQVSTNGTEIRALHTFAGGLCDGATAYGSLTWSGARFYGMASAGGASNKGVVFMMNQDGGGYEILHHFRGGGEDGATPHGSLTLSGTTLYGMTSAGGVSNQGVVFALDLAGLQTRHIELGGDLAFGNVPTNTTAVRMLAITNSGTAALTISAISCPTGFSATWAGVIAAGGTTNVPVSFLPTAMTSYAGNVVVHSDATGGDFSRSVSGAGVARIIALSGNMAFGCVPLATSSNRLLSIANNGNDRLAVSGISFPAGFSGNWSGLIEAGAFTNVPVAFSPSAPVAYGGTITVQSDATGGEGTIACSGEGTGAIISISGDLAFGLVPIDTVEWRYMTISNGGNAMLMITNIQYPDRFSGNLTGAIAGGQATNIAVAFAPTSSAFYGGTVTIYSGALLGSNTLYASGTGISTTKTIGVAADLAFGYVHVGSTATRVLTITNAGDALLSVSAISCPTGFSGNWSGALAGHGAIQVPIAFSPVIKAHYGGTVIVHSDASTGSNTLLAAGKGWQTYTNLHVFSGQNNDGSNPWGSLLLSGSTLYGMSYHGGNPWDHGVVFKLNANGNGYQNLHSFAGAANPYGSLGQAGTMLYGMTSGDGGGLGTVFRMDTNGGGFAVLHTFGGGASDGATPHGDVTIDGATLYGMTREGGLGGNGVIFKMNTNGGDFTVLHTFAGAPTDGGNPRGNLALSGSVLYGMTREGGATGKGIIFRLNTDGSGYGILRSFAGGSDDGAFPYGSLTLAGPTLYGMTSEGGFEDGGVLFSIGTNGTGYTQWHYFGAYDDTMNPYGSLTLAGSNLFGMGWNGDAGMIFQIRTNGTAYTILHRFAGQPDDGVMPYGSLALGGSYLYGMTCWGGTANYGTIFIQAVEGIGPSGYDAWAAQILNGQTNYDQCATGDGYPNLLKYATGSSPVVPDELPAMGAMLQNGQFGLTFRRNTNATDVILVAEQAGGLTNNVRWNGMATNINGSWGGSANVVESGTTTPVAVTVRDPTTPAASNRFMRLRVSRP